MPLHDAFFSRAFGEIPLMAIIRGRSPEETVRLALSAWEAGVSLVEIPLHSPTSTAALTAVLAVAGGRPVGAGTVRSPADVATAQALGAVFTVSPGTDAQVIDVCTDAKIPHLPGVASATDIMTALNRGISWMKAFPASTLGPTWFAAMAAPFPEVRFVATGGVNNTTWRRLFDAGAHALSFGSGLSDLSRVASQLRQETGGVLGVSGE